MTESVRFRQILWAAVGICLVAALIAVPVVSDGKDGTGLPAGDGDGQWVGVAPSASSTTAPSTDAAPGDPAAPAPGEGGASAPASAPPPGGAGGQGGAPVPGGGAAASGGAAPAPSTTASPAAAAPATTAAPPSEDLGPPVDPGPATVPRAGTYRYTLRDDRGEREATTTVEDLPPTAPERRQRFLLRGEDIDTENDIAWRRDGVYVLSSVIVFGQSRGTCDWEPDTVQLRLPLAKGTTWESTSTCSMTGLTPTPIPVSRTVTGKILELRRVRIGGQVVDVWAIEGTDRFEGGGQGGEKRLVALFSPKHGVVVSETGTKPAQDGRVVEYRKDIQNLDPQ